MMLCISLLMVVPLYLSQLISYLEDHFMTPGWSVGLVQLQSLWDFINGDDLRNGDNGDLVTRAIDQLQSGMSL